jgi:hypothetical protein
MPLVVLGALLLKLALLLKEEFLLVPTFNELALNVPIDTIATLVWMNLDALGVKTLLLAKTLSLLDLLAFKLTTVSHIVFPLEVVKLATKLKAADGVKILKLVPLLMLDLVPLSTLAVIQK